MKLFIASGIFHPESGGPATYLHELLPELQQFGWEIRALSYGSGSTEGYGYPLTRIPRQVLPLRLLGYATAASPMLTWADVVYVHSFGLPLLGQRRAPRILKVVGDPAWERAIRKQWIPATTDVDDFQSRHFDHMLVEIDKASRAREASGMDAIIVPSEYLKRMVVGWGVASNKVRVIYNAMPEPMSSGSAQKRTQAEARAELGLPADAPLLLTAARLTPWKGVQHLLTALERTPDVHLLVAGGGEMLEPLRVQAETMKKADRVKFLGNVARERMPLYMRAADYLVLYSGYEGLSHTLLEALREGTPVIASDKGGNPEVVQHGINGLLVPYVDVPALSNALREAFSPGMRERLATNTGIGMERFDFDRMVAQTAGVLAQFAPK